MGLIYEPRGRAREYAALACNIYRGCNHGCTYCFAPGALHITKEEFSQPAPRSEQFIALLEKELVQRDKKGIKPSNVLLCFTCDPYQRLDTSLRLTRRTISLLHRWGYTVTVLTKAGVLAERDMDLFGPGDAFATSLTLIDVDETLKWEPYAATYESRFGAIRDFYREGIRTWVSLEPVIHPEVTLEIINQTHRFVDAYKVGTLNHHPLAKQIDWRLFALSATRLLDSLGYERQWEPDKLTRGQYYIKADLARWLE